MENIMDEKIDVNKMPVSITLHGHTFNPRQRLIQFMSERSSGGVVYYKDAVKWSEYEGLHGLKLLVESLKNG